MDFTDFYKYYKNISKKQVKVVSLFEESLN